MAGSRFPYASQSYEEVMIHFSTKIHIPFCLCKIIHTFGMSNIKNIVIWMNYN